MNLPLIGTFQTTAEVSEEPAKDTTHLQHTFVSEDQTRVTKGMYSIGQSVSKFMSCKIINLQTSKFSLLIWKLIELIFCKE